MIFVKELKLTNFMCHKHLSVVFNKKITCIAGRNGAGKSAVMISIGILFGQKASMLERGPSYKHLIKKGKEFSMIEAKIKNSKKFMHEFFDDGYIVVKKTINLTSAATFKIMNTKGRTYSTKIDDLSTILELYGVNIKNPLNFLTQDNAKKFLNVTKKELLYKFFMEATELASIKALHEETVKYAQRMDDKMAHTESELQSLINKIKKKESELKFISDMKLEKKRLEQLNVDLLISEYFSHKIQTEKIKADYNQKLLNLHEKSSEITDTEMEIEKERNKINEQKAERLKRREEFETLINKLNDKNYKKNEDIRELDQELESSIKDLEEKKKRFAKLHEISKFGQKENIENKIELQKEKLDKLENVMKIEYEFLKHMKTENEDFESFEKKKKENLFGYRAQLNNLRKVQTNKLEYFGENFNKLLEEINNTKFKDTVIGPIGLYLDPIEKDWNVPLSIFLNKRLQNFVVKNSEDRNSLRNIFEKFNKKFPILLAKENKFEYKKTEKRTVLSSLKFKRESLKYQLIILDNIENIGLARDRKEAESIINGLDCVYLQSGDRIKYVFNSRTEFRPNKVRKYFDGGVEEIENKINNLENKFFEFSRKSKKIVHRTLKKHSNNFINKNNDSINISENNFENLDLDLDSFLRSLKLLKQKNFENSTKKYDIQKKLKSLEFELEESLKTVQEDDTKKEKSEIEKAEIQIKDLLEVKKKLNSEIIENEKKILEMRDSFSENKNLDLNKNLELNKKLAIQRRELMSLRLNSESLKSELKENEITLENLKSNAELKILEFKIESKIETIIKEFEKRKEIPNSSNLRHEIIILTEKLAEFKNKKRPTKEIVDEINELEKQKKFKMDLLHKFSEDIKNLLENNELRYKKREEMKEKISKESSEIFEKLLKKRDYCGNLEYNHEKSYLDLKVSIQGNSIAGSKNTLSGGERSFAGVCLLLSLWPFTNSPFKILDEFDVFMDSLNRKKVIEMLFKYFRNCDEQIILITPLSTEELNFEDSEIIILDKLES